MLDGTVFRAPIMVKGIEPCVRNWKKPITIARHAYGDVYKNAEMRVPGPGKAELVYTGDGRHRDAASWFTSSRAPAWSRACTTWTPPSRALPEPASSTPWTPSRICGSPPRTPSPRSTTTASRTSSRRSTTPSTRQRFEEAGIEYFYTLIDDAVARVMKAEGGFIWACKNYDGDVMSDMVSTAFGSPGHDDLRAGFARTATYEYEAAHGTVQRHYYKHLKGEETSTNSGGHHLRLDRRAAKARRAGRAWTSSIAFADKPGEGDARYHRGRRDDRRPRPHHHAAESRRRFPPANSSRPSPSAWRHRHRASPAMHLRKARLRKLRGRAFFATALYLGATLPGISTSPGRGGAPPGSRSSRGCGRARRRWRFGCSGCAAPRPTPRTSRRHGT